MRVIVKMVIRGGEGEKVYTYKITKNQVVWYKDGKRVARKEVPLKEKIRAKKEIDSESSEDHDCHNSQEDGCEACNTMKEKQCILCGAYPNFTRFYNNQIWEVCEDCYYNKTLGQIAEAVRRKNV